MPIESNTSQHIAVLNIATDTKTLIEAKLLEGYLIQSITSLAPTLDKILIVYVLNDIPEPPE